MAEKVAVVSGEGTRPYRCSVVVFESMETKGGKETGEEIWHEMFLETASREEALNVATQIRDYALGTLKKGGVKEGSGQGIGEVERT